MLLRNLFTWSIKWERNEGEGTHLWTYNVLKQYLKLKSHLLVSHTFSDRLMIDVDCSFNKRNEQFQILKWHLFSTATVALHWECCEQQVNMSYRAERLGTPGWHADSQQACWPRRVGRRWTFSHSAAVNSGQNVYVSMLGRFCNSGKSKEADKLIKSFKSFPGSLQLLFKQAHNLLKPTVRDWQKWLILNVSDVLFIVCLCVFKMKGGDAVVTNVEMRDLFTPPVDGHMVLFHRRTNVPNWTYLPHIRYN